MVCIGYGVFGFMISNGFVFVRFLSSIVHSFSLLFIPGDDVSTLASPLYSIFIWLGMVSNPWFAGTPCFECGSIATSSWFMGRNFPVLTCPYPCLYFCLVSSS